MGKVFSRLARVAKRLVKRWSALSKVWKKVIQALSALGLAAAVDSKRLEPWLLSDWTHWVFALTLILSLLSLGALYGAQKDVDEMKFVQVSIRDLTARLYPEVFFASGKATTDVLIMSIAISLRNDSEKATRVFFPKLELLRRTERNKWDPLELALIYDQAVGGAQLRGLRRSSWWDNGQRHEVPARDELIVDFTIEGTSAEGASAFLGRDLKVRVSLDIYGQPISTLEAPLPSLESH